MDGGLFIAADPIKVVLLALDKGKEVEDFMGKDSAELNALPCDASRSNFDVDFVFTVSSNRTAQHARWISSEKRWVKPSATTRASVTTCRNPKRGKREGFGVEAPRGTLICENELKDGVGEVTEGRLDATAAFEDEEIFEETEDTEGMTCWRRCSHLNLEGDRGGGDAGASRSKESFVRLPRLGTGACKAGEELCAFDVLGGGSTK